MFTYLFIFRFVFFQIKHIFRKFDKNLRNKGIPNLKFDKVTNKELKHRKKERGYETGQIEKTNKIIFSILSYIFCSVTKQKKKQQKRKKNKPF